MRQSGGMPGQLYLWFVVAKKNFNLFYDQRDSVNIDKATNQKNKNAGIIMMAAGLMFLIISFFVI